MTVLVLAADAGHATGLVLLDLSSVFDTIDLSLLLSTLQSRFGIDRLALRWFQSYLSERINTDICLMVPIVDVSRGLQRATGLCSWAAPVHFIYG